jgi:hypothetical protein
MSTGAGIVLKTSTSLNKDGPSRKGSATGNPDPGSMWDKGGENEQPEPGDDDPRNEENVVASALAISETLWGYEWAGMRKTVYLLSSTSFLSLVAFVSWYSAAAHSCSHKAKTNSRTRAQVAGRRIECNSGVRRRGPPRCTAS